MSLRAVGEAIPSGMIVGLPRPFACLPAGKFLAMTQHMNLQKIYSTIHRRYELTNHILTLGLDILWRRKAARLAVQLGNDDTRYLDICSGTGETAAYISKFTGTVSKIICADFSEPMLKIACHKKELAKANFVLTDAGRLPFKDSFFDVVTISFATRNINKSPQALQNCFKEFHRVLRNGGTFINLETSRPQNKLIRYLFDLYTKCVVYPIGTLFGGSSAGFKYLAGSMRTFYSRDELSQKIKEAGFGSVTSTPLMLGAAAIHIAK